jgi:hypothetical protein
VVLEFGWEVGVDDGFDMVFLEEVSVIVIGDDIGRVGVNLLGVGGVGEGGGGKWGEGFGVFVGVGVWGDVD